MCVAFVIPVELPHDISAVLRSTSESPPQHLGPCCSNRAARSFFSPLATESTWVLLLHTRLHKAGGHMKGLFFLGAVIPAHRFQYAENEEERPLPGLCSYPRYSPQLTLSTPFRCRCRTQVSRVKDGFHLNCLWPPQQAHGLPYIWYWLTPFCPHCRYTSPALHLQIYRYTDTHTHGCVLKVNTFNKTICCMYLFQYRRTICSSDDFRHQLNCSTPQLTQLSRGRSTGAENWGLRECLQNNNSKRSFHFQLHPPSCARLTRSSNETCSSQYVITAVPSINRHFAHPVLAVLQLGRKKGNQTKRSKTVHFVKRPLWIEFSIMFLSLSQLHRILSSFLIVTISNFRFSVWVKCIN